MAKGFERTLLNSVRPFYPEAIMKDVLNLPFLNRSASLQFIKTPWWRCFRHHHFYLVLAPVSPPDKFVPFQLFCWLKMARCEL